jgi:uncharacterized protein YciI
MYAIVILHQLDPEKILATREAHGAWLRAHSDIGAVLLAGRKSAGGGGVFVLEGTSHDELVKLCATDPFATAGAARHEVIDFEPGYGKLLATLTNP